MGDVIRKLLQGEGENYIFPFFWQHGEPESVLRKYMKVIYDSNVRAVCVESRPHPDFCGDSWWSDMDVILDEAKKCGMKVWILDDSHFPTGYANGALENRPAALHRQSIYCIRKNVKAGEILRIDASEGIELPLSRMEQMMKMAGLYTRPENLFDDDRILAARAVRTDREGQSGEAQILPVSPDKKTVDFAPQEGEWRIFVTFLTRNAGCHRQYINMMDSGSCRVLLDEVYEKHYAHYANDFGKTIAGFFSDEPELGNGGMYNFQNLLGTDQDLPWSAELEAAIEKRLGESWAQELYLLWEDGADAGRTARLRYAYMDCVTRLVQKNFSEQIGGWCRAHGVEYIGHVIEDNNQHARTGSSLGHYFRGLSGQDMAGIDDIGGQVLPQGEDAASDNSLFERDGEFYHFALGKLGVSLGAIDPKKKGRTMCEIFGNYGWEEGVRLEKYLADHFMVRGVNRFVPHAFSPKEYPDPDCPPHFYAQGHNPQYRHFGCLMNYMNRICALIDSGKSGTHVGILYHGEAEWTGKCMLMQKPARILAERQIDYHFLPTDIFAEPDHYDCSVEDGLCVNGYAYRLLFIPYAQYISRKLADAAAVLNTSGKCRIVFLDAVPEGYYDSEEELSDTLKQAEAVKLEDLAEFLDREYPDNRYQIKDAFILPQNKDIRILHYTGKEEIYYLVNEGKDEYDGELAFVGGEDWHEYDAWRNCCYPLRFSRKDSWNKMPLHLYAGESCILVSGSREAYKEKTILYGAEKEKLTALSFDGKWKRSIAPALDYPNFSDTREIAKFQNEGKDYPGFSGFIRYENTISVEDTEKNTYLEITDAHEGVEVFVNRESVGIQIQPPFVYDITPLLKKGENKICVEIATTLERERSQDPGMTGQSKGYEACAPTGITGAVNLYSEIRIEEGMFV